MNTLGSNQFDSIEKMIFDEGLQIESIDLRPQVDAVILVLNTNAILEFSISSFKNLKGASIKALHDYKLVGKGPGIHWNSLDEDLS